VKRPKYYSCPKCKQIVTDLHLHKAYCDGESHLLSGTELLGLKANTVLKSRDGRARYILQGDGSLRRVR
jgi:hypothetical protein